MDVYVSVDGIIPLKRMGRYRCVLFVCLKGDSCRGFLNRVQFHLNNVKYVINVTLFR